MMKFLLPTLLLFFSLYPKTNQGNYSLCFLFTASQADTRMLSSVIRQSSFGASPTFEHYNQWKFTQNSFYKPVVTNISLVNDDSSNPFVFRTRISGTKLNTTFGYTISSTSRFNYISAGNLVITSSDRAFVFINSQLVMVKYLQFRKVTI